jgi:hypothetical protein
MTDIFSQPLAPSPDAVESSVGDETVLLHLKSGTYFGLDPIGTRIWAMLKEGLSPGAICSRLTEEFEVEAEAAEADVRRFLGELKANDILVNG